MRDRADEIPFLLIRVKRRKSRKLSQKTVVEGFDVVQFYLW